MNKYLVPALGFVVVIVIAVTLIGVVVLRNPETHANLATSVGSYDRTQTALVTGGVAPGPNPATFLRPIVDQGALLNKGRCSFPFTCNDPVTLATTGQQLFAREMCATCHNVDAQGGAVGPSLAGEPIDLTKQMARNGLGGMPAFPATVLSDPDLAKMAAYLQSLPTTKASPDDLTAIQKMTYNPLTPKSVVLRGEVALHQSCGACHTQPDANKILTTFSSDAQALGTVASMVQQTNLSGADGRAIAAYVLAILHNNPPQTSP